MNRQMGSKTIKNIDASAAAHWQTPTDEHLNVRYSPPALLLDADGYIQECDKSIESLFGYREHELIWHHISCLFPKLSEMALMQGNRLNPLFNHICHSDHFFEAINRKCRIIMCNLNFLVDENKGSLSLRLIVRPVDYAGS